MARADHIVNILNSISSMLLNLLGVCIILLLIFAPLLLTVVRRHYDPFFGKVGGVKGEVGIPLWSPYIRSLGYAFYLVFKHQSVRKPYAYKLYKGYDFRGNATWSVKIISFVVVYVGFSALFFSIVFCIISFLFGYPAGSDVNV